MRSAPPCASANRSSELETTTVRRDRAHARDVAVQARTPDPTLADAQGVQGLLAHLEASLQDIGYLDPAAPKKLMPRLNQLFNRSNLTVEEIHILRGVAKAMSQAAAKARS